MTIWLINMQLEKRKGMQMRCKVRAQATMAMIAAVIPREIIWKIGPLRSLVDLNIRDTIKVEKRPLYRFVSFDTWTVRRQQWEVRTNGMLRWRYMRPRDRAESHQDTIRVCCNSCESFGRREEKPAAMRYTRNIIAQIRPYGFARQYGSMNTYLSTLPDTRLPVAKKVEYIRERIELATRILNNSRRKVEETAKIAKWLTRDLVKPMHMYFSDPFWKSNLQRLSWF